MGHRHCTESPCMAGSVRDTLRVCGPNESYTHKHTHTETQQYTHSNTMQSQVSLSQTPRRNINTQVAPLVRTHCQAHLPIVEYDGAVSRAAPQVIAKSGNGHHAAVVLGEGGEELTGTGRVPQPDRLVVAVAES